MAEGAPSRKRAFAEEESAAQQQKKVRFPKGKKAKIGDYVVDDASVEVVPGWRDPRLAANERAMARTQLTAELLEEGGEMLQDVSRAEIQYESNETFVDDGVPMEPFNLTQEREEGYFDADGNYVEYITEDIKDAWLDSIEANRNIAPTNNAAEPPKNQKEDDAELSSGNVAEIKRRIADVLEPGETVLQALRRLKGNSNDRKVKMSEETKHVFDQLTEDAMHLLENGEYNVYDEKQETFLREAEGYEKLAEARKQAFTSSTVVDNSSEDAFDMFADEDGSADAAITPAPSDTNDAASNTANHQASDSDYVYDETSGYYYSNSLGYYYDPSSGLYCYASTGQWYSYNEDSGAYEEWQQQEEQEAAASAVSI